MIKNKLKKFNLIELIVVIVVLGILAAIVIPNISNFKKGATKTAITSNIRNLQTAVDTYSLKKGGELPGKNQPEPFKPVPIDYEKINPEHIRTLPEQENIKYWIDFKGVVWASSIDSPTNVTFSSATLNWNHVPEAEKYNIYEVQNYIPVASSASSSKLNLKLIKEVSDFDVTSENKISFTDSLLIGQHYVVSAIDEQGFESAPSGIGYEGYNTDLKDSNKIIVKIPNTVGNTPTNLKFSGTMSVQEEYIYYRVHQKGLYRMKTDFSDNTRISEDITYNLNVVGDWIYYVDSITYQVFKMKLDGTDKTLVLDKKVSGLQVHNGYFYYLGMDSANKLYRSNLEGQEEVLLSSNYVARFYIQNNKLYYTIANIDHRLVTINLDGTNAETFGYNSTTKTHLKYYSFEVDGQGNAYFINNYGTSYIISKSPISNYFASSSVPTLVSSKTFDFFTTNDSVIYRNFSDNENWYIANINGTGHTRLLSDNKYYITLGYHQEWLYMYDHINKKVKRVNHKTKELQELAIE